ncbi:MAG: cell division protein ZapA [Eubacteriales bacterium]|nr:cell division protein ZapA [Eubacteriales bacterium]
MAIKKSNLTDVLIDGKIYSISGTEDAEHIQKVAQLVNDTIQEVRTIPGYKRLDDAYQALLLNLNLADACFRERENMARLTEEAEEKDRELYALKHDMVSVQMKLEAALKQQDRLGERAEEWKKKYEELKAKNDGAKR